MTWTVAFDDSLRIVILTYSGVSTGEDIKEAAVARIALGREKGVDRYLIDTTAVVTDESATSDLFDLPDKFYPAERNQRDSRIAILEPESSRSSEMVRFFESVCVNRGWAVKVFSDRESAIRWL
ncbi:MAG: hypothetical protein JW958_09195 [Candidatus Eisenbacteria bacterium]|nr:hypothetical protein [Candidatus Eisenbacteria bacterium]